MLPRLVPCAAIVLVVAACGADGGGESAGDAQHPLMTAVRQAILQ